MSHKDNMVPAQMPDGVEACAALVAKVDPLRARALLAAPPPLRADLMVLFAFNIEVARAPWASAEPMIAEMRLQWWRDAAEAAALGQGQPPAHEVMGPMARLIAKHSLPAVVLDQLVAARRHDIYREPFEDQADFDAYIEESSAGLFWLAALIAGAGPQAEATARAAGWAQGLAAYLQAVPELEARGRLPLIDGRPQAVADLAKRGLEKLAKARAGRKSLGGAGVALAPIFQAEGLLHLAAREPTRVAEGRLELTEFQRRYGLLKAGLFGRW